MIPVGIYLRVLYAQPDDRPGVRETANPHNTSPIIPIGAHIEKSDISCVFNMKTVDAVIPVIAIGKKHIAGLLKIVSIDIYGKTTVIIILCKTIGVIEENAGVGREPCAVSGTIVVRLAGGV
jgi:hypothetical protein